VLGLLTLLVVAGVLLVALLTAMLVHGATHPPRHGAGYALGRGMPADPGDLGMTFEAWELDAPGGVRLPVWEIAGAADGAPLTVVILHGWGLSRVDMLELAARWRARCERVVVYDLRGHGDATGTSRLGCGEEQDLLALLDRLGDGPFLLVGFSMGGTIAIRAASAPDAGDRVAGVIVRATYDEIATSLPRRLRKLDLPARPLSDLALRLLAVRGVRPRPARDAAARLACPLLVIHGSADDVAPIADAEELAAAAPDGRLLRIEGATHSDLDEVDRAAQDEAIAAFLAHVHPAGSRRQEVAP
jgi:pimeloyl-ACP methyl ester carboxylesterase